MIFFPYILVFIFYFPAYLFMLVAMVDGDEENSPTLAEAVNVAIGCPNSGSLKMANIQTLTFPYVYFFIAQI